MSKKMRQVVGMCKKEQEVMLAQKKKQKRKGIITHNASVL